MEEEHYIYEKQFSHWLRISWILINIAVDGKNELNFVLVLSIRKCTACKVKCLFLTEICIHNIKLEKETLLA